MLVLSRRPSEKLIIGEDLVVSIAEIQGQRVRLGLVPPAGTPIDLQPEDPQTPGGAEIVPEVRLIDGKYQVLVWAKLGLGFRINEAAHVRVVAVDQDRVRLGIMAPCAVPIYREECRAALDREHSDPSREAEPPDVPARVAAEVLSDWIARKLASYLQGRPRGAVQELAQAVGVSPVSINRWRRRETNVATEHRQSLLAALGISLDDLARELNVKQVVPPDIRTRGPVPRSAEAILSRG